MQNTQWPSFVDESLIQNDSTADLFIKKEGITYAGNHLIIDCWDAHHLDDIEHIEQTLRKAVEVSAATLLHIHLHHFTPNGGVSGMAILAESHISIHTWPERGFAALDIFMCGDTKPEKAIPVFEEAFNTHNITLTTHRRGIVKKINSGEKE